MTMARTAVQHFSIGNPIYANAIVTAYTVENGEKTSILSNLYANISGVVKSRNPQILDSFGKFKQPVYIENAVILTITGLENTPDHDTGIISADPILSGSGSPEGVITATPGTIYMNTSGGSGTTLYVKETGSNETGWVSK